MRNSVPEQLTWREGDKHMNDSVVLSVTVAEVAVG